MVRPFGASRRGAAIFRLGTLHEKGLSVKKTSISRGATTCRPPNAETPRRCITSPCSTPTAAARAQLRNASQWFRKAAERGVADSQFKPRHPSMPRIGRRTEPRESSNGSALPRPRAMRTRCANAKISRSGSTPSRSRRQSSRSRLSRQNRTRRRRQRGEPAGRMDQRRRRPVRQSRAKPVLTSEPPLRIDAVGGVAVIYPQTKPCRHRAGMRRGRSCRTPTRAAFERRDDELSVRRSS